MGNFSKLIYSRRVLDKIPLRKVASDIGCSAMAISDLENGKIPAKSELIPKLADYYGLDLASLLLLAEEERKENAIEAAKNGDMKAAFAAARKSEDISKALTDFFKMGGID